MITCSCQSRNLADYYHAHIYFMLDAIWVNEATSGDLPRRGRVCSGLGAGQGFQISITRRR